MQLVLSAGDPAGVGYDICLKLFGEQATKNLLFELNRSNPFELHLVGLKALFTGLIRRHSLPIELQDSGEGQGRLRSSKPPHISATLHAPGTLAAADLGNFQMGRPSIFAAEAALQTLEVALDLVLHFLRSGEPVALITAPVNKKTMSLAWPAFVGHTEWLAAKTNAKPSMAFLSPAFDLVLMTTHVPVGALPNAITPEVVCRSIESAIALRALTGDDKPIAVMGLNPHAGDEGLIGTEDDTIREAMQPFLRRGFSMEGPLPADSGFRFVYQGKYRTVVAAYHDQGLIPLKMLSQGRSVQLTLGLPFLRTSVDHGTAYDLAGRHMANPNSLALALSTACRLRYN